MMRLSSLFRTRVRRYPSFLLSNPYNGLDWAIGNILLPVSFILLFYTNEMYTLNVIPSAKILIRIAHSIKKRGLIRTMRRLLSKLEDRWFDITYGTDTMGRVELAELEIKSSNRLSGVHYEATTARALRNLLGTLEFPTESVFVDIGSGKGRVLSIASEYGFKRVIGVEFSHELCVIAQRNIDIYRRKTNNSADIRIFESDVVNYEIKNDENVFFLYNPFDKSILTLFLKNINLSLQKANRQILLIYNHPIHCDVIEQQEYFVKMANYVYPDADFSVYVSRKLG